MRLKTTAFQLSLLWILCSLLVACSGPTANCDDPTTVMTEYCGSVANSPAPATTTPRSGGSTFIYYRSTGSSYYNSNPARTSSLKSNFGSSGRAGFGRTGSGRSGFG